MAFLDEIPGYEILDLLGEGGTASVFQARQLSVDRHVALKIYGGIGPLDLPVREAFQREAQIHGELSIHPFVVSIFDAGVTSAERPYLAMELYQRPIQGVDVLQPSDGDRLGALLRLGIQVSGALETAHRMGIIHRDVKPGNILLSRFDTPGLTDFGVSSLEWAEPAYGFTPGFAAPEAMQGEPVGPAADVYGLAATLFALVTDSPPGWTYPKADTVDSDIDRFLWRVPSFDLWPNDLSALIAVLKPALSPEPGDRPVSALELAQSLQRIQATSGRTLTPIEVPVRDETGRAQRAPARVLLETATATRFNREIRPLWAHRLGPPAHSGTVNIRPAAQLGGATVSRIRAEQADSIAKATYAQWTREIGIAIVITTLTVASSQMRSAGSSSALLGLGVALAAAVALGGLLRAVFSIRRRSASDHSRSSDDVATRLQIAVLDEVRRFNRAGQLTQALSDRGRSRESDEYS